jgi:uncharacterized protein YegP (UPF0339 family)
MMGEARYELRKTVSGKDYFVLLAGNGEVILVSEDYESRQGMMNGIASVRKNSTNPDAYQKFVGADGKYYFNLRAGNNKVIGTSEAYNWKVSRWFGIRSVKKNALGALIEQA